MKLYIQERYVWIFMSSSLNGIRGEKSYDLKSAVRVCNLNWTTDTALSAMPLHFLLRCQLFVCIFNRIAVFDRVQWWCCVASKFVVDLYITS